ncbi:hypothetical protein [Rhodospirillaceae bacterium SYSU D60014]|uniref:hypothetical protein n=1 Tax=Virgifigura deserti TaxID=2268457 RepID=UPI0013C3F3FB
MTADTQSDLGAAESIIPTGASRSSHSGSGRNNYFVMGRSPDQPCWSQRES